MQFPGQYQTSLTIPTGKTSGARITINFNNDGSIKVYNSAGQLVEEVNPTRGFISFSPSNFVQLNSAGIQFGSYNVNNDTIIPDGTQILEKNLGPPNDQPVLELISASLSGFDQGEIQIVSGIPGNVSGSGLVPRVSIKDFNATTVVDGYISGNWISTDVSNNQQLWQVPTLAAGFTNNNCQYRQIPLDAVQWQGEFSMTAAQAAAGATTIFTLPAALTPKKELIVPASIRNSGGLALNVSCFMAFETNGTVMLGWSAATPAGARFSCAALVALNIIP